MARDRPPASARVRTRVVFACAAAAVVLYGALLRLDALTHTYGPVERPGWLRAMQHSRLGDSALRPASFAWAPHEGRYISDPYTYLQYGREMRSFYAAHRREPVFPLATKAWLWLLDDQDVAVSFAAGFFSVLTIAATYLLGASAFSRVVGLGAAALLAIEYDVITWGVSGWRDDAFACAVVLFAYAMCRGMRAPTRASLALLGVIGGLACLIRVTSLSFVLPGLAWLLLTSRDAWKVRLQRVGLSALISGIIVAPFLINCWMAYGDALYAINVHADVYRDAEGRATAASQTAATYLGAMASGHPMRTLDTFTIGMTAYPFRNKWTGFDRWTSWLGPALSWAAIVGLVLFAGTGSGRALLVVLAASLVPYALTWKLIADWRFTAHAYPFFLTAALVTATSAARLLRPTRWATRQRFAWRPAIAWISLVIGIAATVLAVTRVLPVLTVREALAANEAVTIMAGERDRSFFRSGWSRPQEQGITVRVSGGDDSVIQIPLPRVQDYHLTIRLDPYPVPAADTAGDLPRVHVFANGQMLRAFDLAWNPTRVGAYDIQLPAAVVRVGLNRLTLRARTPSNDSAASIRIWYVRIRP